MRDTAYITAGGGGETAKVAVVNVPKHCQLENLNKRMRKPRFKIQSIFTLQQAALRGNTGGGKVNTVP